MTHSVDPYLSRRYHARTYNCAHLVCDVWRDLTGVDLSQVLQGFLCGAGRRRAVLSDLRRLQPINHPQTPSLVLMQSPRMPAHVGIWLRGRVLHIRDRSGVQFVPVEVATFGFRRVRFFTCN